MNWVLSIIFCFSTVFALITGKTDALSAAVMSGADRAVRLTLALAGPLCLWSGVILLLEALGASDRLSRLMGPVLRRIFPAAWADRETREALCGNVAANLLGLGNAATPLGIRAVQRMKPDNGAASHELCRLVVMNSASLQLIPTTVAALRAGLGAARPFSILPAVWLTSLCALGAGLLAAWGWSKWRP